MSISASGIEYDLRVLEAVSWQAPFNVLHNCGDAIYFDLLADYPVHAISWAATLPNNPTLAEGKQRTTKAVMGGVSEKTTLPDGTPEQVAEEVRRQSRRRMAGACSWRLAARFRRARRRRIWRPLRSKRHDTYPTPFPTGEGGGGGRTRTTHASGISLAVLYPLPTCER